MRLFVGNLPWNTTEEDLRDLFAEFGQVMSTKVMMDRESGRSRGFGFVDMEVRDSAVTAMEQLDGTEYGRRTLRVNEATERVRR